MKILLEVRAELVKEKAIRPIGRSRPQLYGASIGVTLYDFNGVPHWRPEPSGREAHEIKEAHSQSEPPSPPRPPRLPMLANLEGDESTEQPRTVLLSNLQYLAEIIRWPDWEGKDGLFYGWGENWQAEQWDHGWQAKRTRFRLKVIRSPEWGEIVAQFCNNKSVRLTFPRELVHAYRLRDKKDWYDDVVQSVFKHIAKTTGYGFGLVRQVSNEQLVAPLHGLKRFKGGPLEVVLANGNKMLIDQSEGWPEFEVEGPDAYEFMESVMKVPDMAQGMDGIQERQERLENVVREQSGTIQRLTDLLESVFTPKIPKNGDDRKGYQ